MQLPCIKHQTEDTMTPMLTRRSFVARTLGIASTSAALITPAGAAETPARTIREPFRGVFPIMQTPYHDNFEIDEDTVRREVNFLVECGTHGITWPQLASEYYVLTDEERLRTADIIVKAARGRVPVIIGVQSTNWWKTSLTFARRAEEIGADGIISLPPFTSNATIPTTIEYFRTLAQTVKLPVFIQNTGGRYGTPLSVDAMLRLAREFPQIAYVKEEAEPNLERIAELASKGKGLIKGVFSGNSGVKLLEELPRGSAGTCPCASLVDVMAQVYDAWVSGDRATAEKIFAVLLPMQTYDVIPWPLRDKEILRRRGIFSNTVTRIEPFKLVWTDDVRRGFESRYEALNPYLKV